MPGVPVKPLFPQHCNKCSEERDQEASIHEYSDGDNFSGRSFLGRWDSVIFARDGRLIESDKDRAEEGCGFAVWIRLQFRMNIDNEGSADGGEESGLRTCVSEGC